MLRRTDGNNNTVYVDKKNKELISNGAKLAYPIIDGIPVMIPDQARKIK